VGSQITGRARELPSQGRGENDERTLPSVMVRSVSMTLSLVGRSVISLRRSMASWTAAWITWFSWPRRFESTSSELLSCW